ncbi:Cro protein [Mycobacterium phage Squirty]|uniref:Cro protein n=2 Tax=Gracegardnervirinae TaxID=2946632 RepID=A0A088FBI3_9CAUD|nr:CRO protein [Mycobacterium phage Squirty]YP_009956074.1 helix-turn-helix DNA binding protein [Mycobacterium phage Donkeykong]AXC35585.1 Cro protein [Mycobacterium phage Clifton]QKO03042.1 Cro protein [Mycobacterium phage LastJedi]QYC54835.1 Cro protein [Mycobacterium phage Zizzle]AIM40986.1 Cro protein [Mycobacterium phage Squirty]QGJ90833.1 helix-turn-helix DNA binding protein [Mycobacterium phage Donkeykong]
MGFTTRDMYAECDLALFVRALRRSGLTYEALADESARELRKIARAEKRKRRGDGIPTTISKQLIGQLATGRAKSTHELRGIAIERALGVGDGDIFVPRVVRGVRTEQRTA